MPLHIYLKTLEALETNFSLLNSALVQTAPESYAQHLRLQMLLKFVLTLVPVISFIIYHILIHDDKINY